MQEHPQRSEKGEFVPGGLLIAAGVLACRSAA